MQVGSAPSAEAVAPPSGAVSTAPVDAQAAPQALSASPSAAAVVAPSTAPLAPAAAPAAPRPEERWAREGFVFVFDGQEWDAATLASVDQALSLIPARIRGQLGDRGLGPLHILVNREGRTLGGTQPYGRAANFFSTNEGRNELVLFPGQSAMTIIHELGHAYNLRRVPAGRYALVLLDDEMGSFMAASGWSVQSTPDQVRAARDHLTVQMSYSGPSIWPRLSNNDPLEDFANSFAAYYATPDDLHQRSPGRFDWFQRNLGR